MKTRSILARFFIGTLILFALVLTLVTAVEYRTARKEVDRLFDSRLEAGAEMLRALMEEELNDHTAEPGASPARLLSSEDRAAFARFSHESMFFDVWQHGAVAETSGANVGAGFDIGALTIGHHHLDTADGKVAIAVLKDTSRDIAILVGEPVSLRNAPIMRAVADLTLPALLIIPGLFAAAWLASFEGVRSTRRLVEQLGARSIGDLSPLAGDHWPSELLPMVKAMNTLLARLSKAISAEQRVIAQAAHQLRTPLASLSLQLDLARRARDADERAAVLGRMGDTVRDASHSAERLLALARLEEAGEIPGQGDLRTALEAAVIDLLPLAEERGQTLIADAATAAAVTLDGTSCHLLCTCLIENAVKYGPVGSTIRVFLERSGSTAFRLRVRDEGPGIPAAERALVLDRFTRGSAAAGTHGTGLGLAIVAAAVKRAGGRLSLNSPPQGGGLEVEVELPAAES